MELDIETEHVTMRPDWHAAIDRWVARCAKEHPEVTAIAIKLGHDPGSRGLAHEVAVVATARGRDLRATRRAVLVDVAMHEAFEAVERELLVHEAVRRAA